VARRRRADREKTVITVEGLRGKKFEYNLFHLEREPVVLDGISNGGKRRKK